MNIEKMIKELGSAAAKVLFNKREKSTEDKIEADKMSGDDILPVLLKRLVYEGNYNKAEDLLFKEINNNNSVELYKVGVDFYNLLSERSDEELVKNNFLREEIHRGLEDLKKYVI